MTTLTPHHPNPTDSSLHVSTEELEVAYAGNAAVAFEQMDVDDSGFISKEEWTAWICKPPHPTIL